MSSAAMQNSFDQPDLELMLRGRPAELQPVKIQMLPPAVLPRTETGFLARQLRVLRRRRLMLMITVLAGAVLAAVLSYFQPRMYTSRISLDVTAPANAEAVVHRIQARGLLELPARKLRLPALPEYTHPRSPANLVRRVVGISPAPSDEDFVRELEQQVRLTAAPQGRAIEIEFSASDPPLATAYLDVLAEEITRGQEASRADALRLVRETFSVPIARARADVSLAEEDLSAYLRSAGLLDPKTAGKVEERFSRVGKRISGVREALPADSTAAAEAGRLEQSLERARIRVASMRADQSARYQSKRRDLEAKLAAYDAVVARQQSAETAAADIGIVRAMAPARLVPGPRRPGVWFSILAGALGGLLLGVPLCLATEAVSRTLTIADDITRYVGVPSLGTIPHAHLRRTTRGGRAIIDLNPATGPGGIPLFTGIDVKNAPELRASGLAEAFRHLLASIWIAGQNTRRPRVLLFASSVAREGKTTISANLGIALANTRRRVLVIDADLRHPQMHSIFGAPSNWGLANILEQDEPIENYSFEDLIFKTEIPGLYVLPAGTGKLAIAGMRHVERLTELLQRFRLEFHGVLIDTPGGLAYPEARILSRLSDAVVLVTRANHTSRDRAARLARQLESDGGTLLGAVLNDFRGTRG